MFACVCNVHPQAANENRSNLTISNCCRWLTCIAGGGRIKETHHSRRQRSHTLTRTITCLAVCVNVRRSVSVRGAAMDLRRQMFVLKAAADEQEQSAEWLL